MKYYLHYIGSGLYPKEQFMEEAKRLGVSRRIGNFQLRRCLWGQQILLGTWQKIEQQNEGKAECFGYMTLTGLNMDCSEELRRRLIASLEVVSTEAVNKRVLRRCGSYFIGCTTYVMDSIEQIVDKANKLAEEMNEKVTWFMQGVFHQFREDLVFQPCQFSRTLKNIETEANIFELGEKIDIQRKLGESGFINFIYDYEQRKYLKKADKEALEQAIDN